MLEKELLIPTHILPEIPLQSYYTEIILKHFYNICSVL